MESRKACREDSRQRRRRRRHRRLLGARADQPYHCHPDATEIYFCFTGGGTMRTPSGEVEVAPGAFVVHPPGELHEYANGPQRTLLFRVRYGADMGARCFAWRGHAGWTQSGDDTAYFRDHPPGAG